MNRFFSILALLASCLPALGQTGAPIKQSDNVTPGHAVMWTTNGIAQDAGTAVQGFLTSVGVTASGDAICQNSAPPTSAGWQRICLGVTTAGGADISVQNFGTASALPLTFNLNGSAYQFPFTLPGTGVIGPNTTVIGDFALWNNVSGTLLKDVTQASLIRIKLTTGITLYVNPSSTTSANCNGATCVAGNDNNTCLTIGAPCLTPQHAINILQQNYDIQLQQPIIQLSDNNITGATYTCTTIISNMVGAISGGNAAQAQLIVQGNTSNPTNVQIQGCSGNAGFSLIG